MPYSLTVSKDIRKMANNTLVVGGITLERESGAATHAAPISVYTGLQDEHVQEFWHWLGKNNRAQKALADCAAILSDELVKFGDARLAAQKKKK